MTATAPAASAPAAVRRPCVMIVDDSAVVRGLLARWVETEARLGDPVTFPNGEAAVKAAGTLKPDLVVLDIEMPKMDGLTALPLILKAAPQAKVVMASTLTRNGAEVTMRALALGAADYEPKPEAGRVAGAEAYRQSILEKLVALSPQGLARPAVKPSAPPPAPKRTFTAQVHPARELSAPAALVALGASTGGPEALRILTQALPREAEAPIVIAQHMPKVFTAIFAEHLAKSGVPAQEAKADQKLEPGRVYIAPGDYHLTVEAEGGGFIARLDQSPPVNFCRPAVDPLFESCAAAAGPGLVAAVLTGMGYDGRTGARAIKEAGGAVYVQNAATSVVWGMPGAVAEAGLADGILSLDELAKALSRRMKGRA